MKCASAVTAQIFALACLSGCQASTDMPAPPRQKRPSFPVQVDSVRPQSLEYAIHAVGSIEAFEHMPVAARVAGVVERLRFTEGDHVQRGQVLLDIEVERYVLAVQAARATLRRAQAAEAEAVQGVQRRVSNKDHTPGLFTPEELQQWQTRAATFGAETQQAQVRLAEAELNLRDARVRSPDDAVIETRDVQTGQFVQVGTKLASLVRRNPLLVRFEVADLDAARLQVDMPLRLTLRHGKADFTGSIIHIASAADNLSRMVQVTAKVADSHDPALRPGAFADVVVPVGGSPAASVVPQSAVRSSERGFLAYIVDDQVARERPLRLGMRTAEGQVEVLQGLLPGDHLVTRGAEALYDGAAIHVVAEPTRPEQGQGAP